MIRLFTAALLAAAPAAALADQTLQAPNSHVEMSLPDAFKPAERFSGFVDETTGSSVVVLEAPGTAWEDMKQLADAPEALASKGITEVVKAELPGRTGDYVYITGKQANPAGPVGKYMLITRDKDRVALISVNVPLTAAAQYPADVMAKTLTTVAIKADMAAPLELFKLGYVGPFKQVATLMGSSKGYNLTGQLPDPNDKNRPIEPLFIVAPSLDMRPLAMLEQAAQTNFQAIADLKETRITSQGKKTIAGLEAYEIVGEGVEGRGNKIVGVVMTLIAGEKGGYFVQIGTALKDDMAKFLGEFQQMAASFEPVRR